MPRIVVLPHAELCPEGKTVEGVEGKSLLDNLLDNGVEVEHACDSVVTTEIQRMVQVFDSPDERGRVSLLDQPVSERDTDSINPVVFQPLEIRGGDVVFAVPAQVGFGL